MSTGYLQTLSQPELEKIGLKAVAAGAKPGDLQQAFVTAQTQGDWSKLETLISNALGPDAIKDPNANNPISGISNLIGNFIGKLIVSPGVSRPFIWNISCPKMLS